jgi:hypothetical protein
VPPATCAYARIFVFPDVHAYAVYTCILVKRKSVYSADTFGRCYCCSVADAKCSWVATLSQQIECSMQLAVSSVVRMTGQQTVDCVADAWCVTWKLCAAFEAMHSRSCHLDTNVLGRSSGRFHRPGSCHCVLGAVLFHSCLLALHARCCQCFDSCIDCRVSSIDSVVRSLAAPVAGRVVFFADITQLEAHILKCVRCAGVTWQP